MEHSVCIEQLIKLGASPGSVSLVKAFLKDRVMTVKVDGISAKNPVRIRRGSPQGSVLGCLLYCVATQALTVNLRGDELGDGLDPNDGRRPGVFLYVDNTTLLDTVSTEDACLHLSTAATAAHFSDLALEGDFAELSRRAEEINMKINARKTQLLVICPRNGNVTSASIEAPDGQQISSVDSIKLVGFTFGQTPNAAAHVESIKERFRRRIWMVYHLCRAGFRRRILYRLYCCYLRTVVEYCSAVYHPLLNKSQSEELEAMHRVAIRICFGFETPVGIIMQEEDIETLEARRIRRCDNFLRKAAANSRFRERWFPGRAGEGRVLRRRRVVQETRAATLRRYRSPLAFYQRRANELNIFSGVEN